MTFDPAAHGLSLTDPAASLIKAKDLLAEMVGSVKDSGATLADAEKRVRENSEVTYRSYDYISIVRDTLFEDNEALTIGDWLHLADAMKVIAGDVRSFADYLVTEEARKNRPAVPADVTEKKAEAAELREFIVNLFGVCKMMNLVPDEFPTKQNKNKELVPDLDRLPNISSGTGNAGRGAKVRSLRYTIDGVAVPAGVLFDELCFRFLSSDGTIVRPKNLREVIEGKGDARDAKKFFAGWTVNVNGHKVTGFVPVDGADDEMVNVDDEDVEFEDEEFEDEDE